MTAYTNVGQRIWAVKDERHEDLSLLVGDVGMTIENQSHKRAQKSRPTQWIGFLRRAYTRPLSGLFYDTEGSLVYDVANGDDPTLQILDYQTEITEGHFNVGTWRLDGTGNANESGITVLNTECTADGDLQFGKWKDVDASGVVKDTSGKPDIVFPTEFWPDDLHIVMMLWSHVNGVSIGGGHEFIARVQQDGQGAATYSATFQTPAFFDGATAEAPRLYIHIQELLSGSDPVPNEGNTGGIQGALEFINTISGSSYHHWLAPNKIGFASPGAKGGIT